MKHWVFDLDGTLVDSSALYEKSLKTIFAKFELPFGPRELERAYQYFNPYDLFAHYLSSQAQQNEAVDLLVRLSYENSHEISVYEGMLDIVAELRSRGVAISVWTGRDLRTATRLLEQTGIGVHVERCISRTCVAQTKPAPEGLIRILDESKHRGEDVVMVGDHEYDIAGARAAGVKAVSVSWGVATSPLEQLSDHHFWRVSEFRDWALGHYGDR
ncbi:MAG: HAD family hydrolase [Bdellovibrionota bacterium]